MHEPLDVDDHTLDVADAVDTVDSRDVGAKVEGLDGDGAEFSGNIKAFKKSEVVPGYVSDSDAS